MRSSPASTLRVALVALLTVAWVGAAACLPAYSFDAPTPIDAGSDAPSDATTPVEASGDAPTLTDQAASDAGRDTGTDTAEAGPRTLGPFALTQDLFHGGMVAQRGGQLLVWGDVDSNAYGE